MSDKHPAHPEIPDPPQFLSTGAMQDPTLRTPGSEIPETVYAISDAEPFDIRNMHNHIAAPVTRDNPLFLALLAILLLAIIAATVIYLYRDTHRATPPTAPPPRSTLSAPTPALPTERPLLLSS